LLGRGFVARRRNKCGKLCIGDKGFVHPKAGDGDCMDRGCVIKQVGIATHLKAVANNQDHIGVVGGDSDWELVWRGWRLTSLCTEENHRY
jgi:hypothetical protein